MQFFFLQSNNFLNVFVGNFLKSLINVFGFSMILPLSYVISFFLFIFLLFCCFFGYFVYSFTPCGMVEFTFFCAFVAWFSTFLSFISSEKFSVYMSKSGDNFSKTFVMLMIELVSEFSRPFSLTIRLTVNVSVGHLICLMVYNLLEFFSFDFFWLTLFSIMLECFVFFIQSYIFSRLIFLYLSE